MTVRVELLADHPHLISSVGEMRWADWGHPPESEDVEAWIASTQAEVGRDSLPITWVAIDDDGQAVGAVGLGQFDIEEVVDRSPWVLGMIVRPEARGRGTGRMLIAALERWAAEQGFDPIWVATEQAEEFYKKCGWVPVEKIVKRSGDVASILMRSAA